MASTRLLKKLRMQPGQRALILNAPQHYLDELVPLPEGVELVQEPEGNLDFVHVFAKDLEELEKLDIDSLSPLEALTKLYELQKKAREG